MGESGRQELPAPQNRHGRQIFLKLPDRSDRRKNNDLAGMQGNQLARNCLTNDCMGGIR